MRDADDSFYALELAGSIHIDADNRVHTQYAWQRKGAIAHDAYVRCCQCGQCSCLCGQSASLEVTHG